jgi:hypothetical protein
MRGNALVYSLPEAGRFKALIHSSVGLIGHIGWRLVDGSGKNEGRILVLGSVSCNPLFASLGEFALQDPCRALYKDRERDGNSTFGPTGS